MSSNGERLDTIIIGGGVVGLCTAYYLGRRGQAVRLFEQDSIAETASAGNAGIVALGRPPLPRPGLARKALRWMFDGSSPLYIRPRLDPGLFRWFWRFHRACNNDWVDRCTSLLAAMGRQTRECWQEIVSDEGIDCGFRESGWLNVFRSEQGRRDALHEAEFTARYGFHCEELTGDELREREPAFRDDVLGAVNYPESLFLDPGLFAVELAARLAGRGVSIDEGMAVTELVMRDDRCVGVRTAAGESVAAGTVVLAAGAWSVSLARQIRLHLPLEAGKGYHLDLEASSPRLGTACVCEESFVAVTPLGNTLRLAGTLEFSGINRCLNLHRLEMLRQGAQQYLHGVADARIESRWCGLRPCTADGLPVVGWAPRHRGLFIATGHAKMGLTHGPITGRLVSECVLDARPSLDISLLRADRF